MTDLHQFSIFHHNNDVQWRTTTHKGNVGDFTDSNRSLQGHIKVACEFIGKNWPCDFYFSTRTAAEVAAAKPAQDAALLQKSVPGASIFVLSPEGSRPHDSESWASAWRNPFGGISSAGRGSRFKMPPGRTDTLIAVIEDWFAKEGWLTFEPRHHREGAPGHPVVHRPPFHRELLVRCAWRVHDICPEAWAPAQSRPAAKPAPDDERMMQQAAHGRFLEAHS